MARATKAPVIACEVRERARIQLLWRLRNGEHYRWYALKDAVGDYAYESAREDGGDAVAAEREALEWLAVARREAEVLGEITVGWPGPVLRITEKGQQTLTGATRRGDE